MFNVIRLPTKFSRTIKRFTDKEKSELLGMLISIWDWETISIPDTIVWDTISLIYWEWMNMESKNGNKPENPLIQYPSDISPSNSGTRVEYSIVEEKRIEESVLVAPKVTTLQSYIKEEFSLTFITDIYNKYNLTKEDFWEECEMFVAHWREKSPNWIKERWQKEKTFDPKLRFRKWMKNKKDWWNTVIINSEDEERNKKLAELAEKKKLLFNKL